MDNNFNGAVYMQSEEKFSFYSHFSGFILVILGAIYLLYMTENFLMQVLASIYGISVIFLFLNSSLYHAHKKYDGEDTIWRKLDHIAIFIMIAGTYTPICFVYLQGYWKWSIIIIQWSLVLAGIFFKFFYLNAPRWLYTTIYVLMGWIGIIPIAKLINAMTINGLIYLFLGGILYTVGAIFYIFKGPQLNKYFGFHEIFHLFILIGAFFHYLLIYTAVT